jgi:hypothetical protein
MKLTTEEMILGGLALLAFVAVFAKAVQHRRVLSKARIREPDGRLRTPDPSESRALAESLAFARGRHFWHIMIGGAVVVTGVWLVLKLTGHIGTGQ